MNRKSIPLLIKPKACRPKPHIPTIQSEPCFCERGSILTQCSIESTDLEMDYSLDRMLERRMKSENAAMDELQERSTSSTISLLFRPPSTRPVNPFTLGLVSD